MNLLKQPSKGVTLLNGNFEEYGVKYWIPYKGTVGESPINEVYTNPTYVSIKSSSVSPLIGFNSGVITKTSGNAQGEGVYTTFNVEEGLRNSNLKLTFKYKITGTYSAGVVRVYIYDTVNNVVIPSSIVNINGDSSVSIFETTFSGITNTADYRLYFHVASSATDAFQLIIDEVNIEENTLPIGAVISEWRDYSLEITATTINPTPGTVVQNKAQWRRVGSNIEIRIDYETSTAGTAGSGTYMFNMPTGIVADISKFPTINAGSGLDIMACGIAYVYNSTPNSCIAAQVAPYSKTTSDPKNQLVIYTIGGISPHSINAINQGNFSMGNAIRYHLSASFPVVGWTSNINLITDYTEYAFNTQTTINTNDTTSFGYGAEGTPILANTALTYYDIAWLRPIQPTDSFVLELRSKVDGAWIPYNLCQVDPYHRSLVPDSISSLVTTGIAIQRTTVNRLRIIFGSIPLSNDAGSGVSWSTWISASNSFDRWRVRKISNGNMAESPASGIYESGENANGRYVKYVDGTMVQWTKENLIAPETGSGTSRTFTWTFPIPFADIGYYANSYFMENTSGLGSYNSGLNDIGASTSSCIFRYYADSATGTSYARAYAIGKWNLSRYIAPSGTIVNKNQIYARAYISGSKAVTANAAIPLDAIEEDAYNTITLATGRFTAPRAGLYLISGYTNRSTTAGNTLSIFKKNGALKILTTYLVAAYNISYATTVRLAQNDFIDLRIDGNITITALTMEVVSLEN